MSAAPSDPPVAESLPDRGGAAVLLRFGRWVDRGNLLTLGGWGLFAGSTVLAAALAAPAPVASEPVQTADAPPAAAGAETPTEDAPQSDVLPVRVASLPGAGPIRRWPSPPEGYEPPPIAEVAEPGESGIEPGETCVPPGDDVPPPGGADPASPDPWADALADLPPAAADDLTAMREQFGSLVPFVPSPPTEPLPTPAEPAPLPAEPAAPLAPPETDLAALRARLAAARVSLADALTPGFRRVEPCGSSGLRVILTPGPLMETGRPLDLALTGPGWFALLPDDDGAPPVLTRDGSFCLRDGFLVLASDPDRRVRGVHGGAIAVGDEPGHLSIAPTGQVFRHEPEEEGGGDVEVGRVAVVAPADAAAVEPLGGALYRPLGPVHPVREFTARARFIEQSNVEPAAEIAGVEAVRTILEELAALPSETPAVRHVRPQDELRRRAAR
ncbi:hypothetical protein [Alienimonas sp. DA493]|uniref:hypothetical protein n=1 Tax=Alienimonas sp. DA493 TaxID=3373605 RepID=UPI003754711F